MSSAFGMHNQQEYVVNEGILGLLLHLVQGLLGDASLMLLALSWLISTCRGAFTGVGDSYRTCQNLS